MYTYKIWQFLYILDHLNIEKPVSVGFVYQISIYVEKNADLIINHWNNLE